MRNEKPNSGLEKKRTALFYMGLVVASSITLAAFEWRTFDYEVYIPTGEHIAGWEFEEPPIRLPKKKEEANVEPLKKKEEPKKRSTDVKVVEDKKEIKAKDVELFKNDIIDDEPTVAGGSGDAEDTIFVVVEDMPHYKACENLLDKGAQAQCTEGKFFKHLKKHTKYPSMELHAGIQGVVWVSFVVNKKGKVTNVEVLKGVSPGLDKEAVRVVELFPRMEPGTQRGRAVNVSYNIPIRFKKL